MEKLVMERRAYDNKYLHRDFHATLDIGMAYLGDRFGEEQVDRYLAQYVQVHYTPMTLRELENYFVAIYKAEEAEDALKTELKRNILHVKIAWCPGLRYLNAHGGASKWYDKTTSVLYAELAKKCGLEFKLISYDKATGKAEFEFLGKES